METKEGFEKEFSTLRKLGEEVFVLRGSTILVELLPDEELKTKGGLIIATNSDQPKGNSVEQHKLQVGKVLMVGQGYWEDDGGYQPVEVQPGAIVILPQYSAQYISMFPGIQRPTANKIAMIKMDVVLGYYPNAKAYEKAKAKLK